jgi:hypothetical protein
MVKELLINVFLINFIFLEIMFITIGLLILFFIILKLKSLAHIYSRAIHYYYIFIKNKSVEHTYPDFSNITKGKLFEYYDYNSYKILINILNSVNSNHNKIKDISLDKYLYLLKIHNFKIIKVKTHKMITLSHPEVPNYLIKIPSHYHYNKKYKSYQTDRVHIAALMNYYINKFSLSIQLPNKFFIYHNISPEKLIVIVDYIKLPKFNIFDLSINNLLDLRLISSFCYNWTDAHIQNIFLNKYNKKLIVIDTEHSIRLMYLPTILKKYTIHKLCKKNISNIYKKLRNKKNEI